MTQEPVPGRPAAPRADRRWGDAVVSALLATLEQPGTWLVSLVGFLARGGLLLFLLPIVTLPTPAGLQTQLAPILQPSLLNSGIAAGLVPFVAAVSVVVAVWLIASFGLGAWADVALVGSMARELDEPADDTDVRDVTDAADVLPPPRPGLVGGALAARLLAHLPLLAAIAWAAVRLFQGAYEELLTPLEVVTPLVVRILTAVPDAVAVVLVAWLLGEAAGGLAVREVVLADCPAPRAALRGWAWLVRHPVSSLGTLAVTTLIVALAIVPALVASGTAWDRLRRLLFDRGDGLEISLALGAFVALWLGGLVLAAVSTTVRSAVWTVEWRRRRARGGRPVVDAAAPSAFGTIGAGDGADRGGWPPSGASGTL